MSLPKIKTIRIVRFFTDTLGVSFPRQYAWGAVDPKNNRVFLCVWKDDIQPVEDGERILVFSDEWRRRLKKLRLDERDKHIAQIRKGAAGFGVVRTAVDPRPTEPRKAKSLDGKILLQLGAITKENDRTYAHIKARIPVSEVTRHLAGQRTIIEDLETLEKENINSTTKDRLVSARLGQGVFRSQVLRLWDRRCSVTRSTTLDAIEASHIKSWRRATNDERLDRYNGLPLVASLHALFDAGLISFETSGALVVSPFLSESEQQIFGIQSLSLAKTPIEETAKYLAYHHEHVFQK